VKTVIPTDRVRAIGPYAWPGGYPLFFIDDDDCAYCYDCACQTDCAIPIVAYEINEEDPELVCEGCGKRIQSAWGTDVD
jgi:TPP-dependent indolepyruvate ferredoxin oxidoreductase alpha subunit